MSLNSDPFKVKLANGTVVESTGDPTEELLSVVDRLKSTDTVPLTGQEKLIARMAVVFALVAIKILPESVTGYVMQSAAEMLLDCKNATS